MDNNKIKKPRGYKNLNSSSYIQPSKNTINQEYKKLLDSISSYSPQNGSVPVVIPYISYQL